MPPVVIVLYIAIVVTSWLLPFCQVDTLVSSGPLAALVSVDGITTYTGPFLFSSGHLAALLSVDGISLISGPLLSCC